jgi:hypothetical protein
MAIADPEEPPPLRLPLLLVTLKTTAWLATGLFEESVKTTRSGAVN